jgi:hypothetical protein
MSDTDKAARELDHRFHSEARVAWSQQNLRWEAENAFLNHKMLFDKRAEGRVRCLSECPPNRGPCIVIGSGSSLDRGMEKLKEWRGAIMCSTSHGTTLVHHGIQPTYMSCLDPRSAPDPELSVPPGGWEGTHYLAHVSTPPAYFKQWFEDTTRLAYVFRILEPTVPWYTKYLPWAYPWIKSALLPFIDSVASSLTLASKMGFDPIFCLGVDYGGPRFRQSLWKGGKWEVGKMSGIIFDSVVPSTGQRMENVEGAGGLVTDGAMIYAKRGFLISAFMRLMDSTRPARIYQMSKPSNILEFPFVSLDEVVEKNGAFPLWTPEYRAGVAEEIEVALAQSDTYLLPVEGGFGTDYRVYMLSQENALEAVMSLNLEMLKNKADLLGKERDLKMSTREMIEKGILQVEQGELLIHDAVDLPRFDAHKMAGADIEKTVDRVRYLFEKSKAGRSKTPGAVYTDGMGFAHKEGE